MSKPSQCWNFRHTQLCLAPCFLLQDSLLHFWYCIWSQFELLNFLEFTCKIFSLYDISLALPCLKNSAQTFSILYSLFVLGYSLFSICVIFRCNHITSPQGWGPTGPATLCPQFFSQGQAYIRQ